MVFLICNNKQVALNHLVGEAEMTKKGLIWTSACVLASFYFLKIIIPLHRYSMKANKQTCKHKTQTNRFHYCLWRRNYRIVAFFKIASVIIRSGSGCYIYMRGSHFRFLALWFFLSRPKCGYSCHAGELFFFFYKSRHQSISAVSLLSPG